MQKTFQPFLINRRHYLALALCLGVFVVASAGLAKAATTDTTDFSQTVTAGTLSIEIVDENYATVGSPSVTMQSVTFSFTSQTSSATTFGTNTQRVYWENPDAADGGYAITMAATGGSTAVYSAGVNGLDFNDPTAPSNDNNRSNDDGADADGAPGQMHIDASTGTITARYGSGTTGLTEGSSTAFNEGVTDSVPIITAAAGADDIYAAYTTGMTVQQELAEQQAAGTYTINMTLTIA